LISLGGDPGPAVTWPPGLRCQAEPAAAVQFRMAQVARAAEGPAAAPPLGESCANP